MYVPLNYSFFGGFLYVASPGIKPMTFAHPGNTPTNWATWQGLVKIFLEAKDNVYEKNGQLAIEKDKTNFIKNSVYIIICTQPCVYINSECPYNNILVFQAKCFKKKGHKKFK